MRRRRGVMVAAVLVAGVGAVGCGDDGGGDGGNEAAQVAGASVERYCAATAELDELSDDLINEDAQTPEEVQAGFVKLMEAHGQELDALVDAAPAEIRVEVEKGVDAFRKAAEGDFSAIAEFDDTKVAEFEEKNCN